MKDLRLSVELTDDIVEALAAQYVGCSVAEFRRLRDQWPKQAEPLHPIAIGHAIEMFLGSLRDARQPRALRPLSYRAYRGELSYLQSFLRRELPDGQLHDVQIAHLQKWLSQPPRRRGHHSDRCADRTLARKFDFLRRFFDYALAEHWVIRNPLAGEARPKIAEGEPRYVTEEEYAKILRVAQNGRSERDVLMLRLMGESGLRIGAVCKLRVRDVHLSTFSYLVLRDGKGGRTTKAVLLGDLAQDLRGYIASIGLSGHPSHFLFHRNGHPWSPLTEHRVWEIFRSVLRIAVTNERYHELTPHCLRHRFGHWLRLLGMPQDDIRILMGHVHITTTQIYTRRPIEEVQTAIAERLKGMKPIA